MRCTMRYRNVMKQNTLNRTEMAKHFGISKGRMSQLLHDVEIDFSIEKWIEIALKMDNYLVFDLMDKSQSHRI